MKALIIVLIFLLSLVNTYRYSKIIKKEVERTDPSLAMWFIFTLAVTLNAASLLIQRPMNLEAVFYSLADVIMCASVGIVIVVRAGGKVVFSKFERYCLLVSYAIAVFWFVTMNSFWTSIIAQIILVVGYFPTVRKIKEAGRNTEPFSIWILALVNGFLSLHPALASGKLLSIIYSVRAIVSISVLLVIMYVHERKSKRTVI